MEGMLYLVNNKIVDRHFPVSYLLFKLFAHVVVQSLSCLMHLLTFISRARIF